MCMYNLDNLDKYFGLKVNVIPERARFHQQSQLHGQSSEELIRWFHELEDSCHFKATKNENIKLGQRAHRESP